MYWSDFTSGTSSSSFGSSFLGWKVCGVSFFEKVCDTEAVPVLQFKRHFCLGLKAGFVN
jgi:hypothetical protein